MFDTVPTMLYAVDRLAAGLWNIEKNLSQSRNLSRNRSFQKVGVQNMKSFTPIIAVSLLSATLVGTTCAADIHEKQKDLVEKQQEVREAQKELKQEVRKELVETTHEANKEMLQVSRASKINGTNVKNTKGENMGGIKDLVIDPESGRVVYAVVSFGGILGLGNKLFAIPWSVLQWNREKEYYVLDLDKETLKNAPGFDKDHWPDSSNKWDLQREEINQFYHVKP